MMLFSFDVPSKKSGAWTVIAFSFPFSIFFNLILSDLFMAFPTFSLIVRSGGKSLSV